MSSRGWIKLHRRIQDHWLYQEDRQFSRYEAWLDLIMMANHKDNKVLIDGELVTVKKGSLFTSKRKLCEKWQWSNTKVDNFLKLLQQDEMIITKSDTKKTVVTIANYEVYHEREKEKRHRNDTETTPESGVLDENTKSDTEKNDTETSGVSPSTSTLCEVDSNGKNDTETKQKRNRNETEAYKQELKELQECKEVSSSSNSAYGFYENNFGMISPFIAENIEHWINDLNESLVIESMKIALKAGKQFNYAEGIMKDWKKSNVKTIKDTEAKRRNFNKDAIDPDNPFKYNPEVDSF